jgi:hypothetical protein
MKRTRFKGHESNDLFDLDSYLEEKASEESSSKNHNLELNKKPTVKRNMVAIGIIATFLIFWTFIGVPSFFISFEDDKIPSVPDYEYTFMQPPVPSPPPVNSSEQIRNFDVEYLDYLDQLNAENLNMFSSAATQAFHGSGVPVEYLKSLDENGLISSFSYSAIIGLYVSGVSISYLSELYATDLLDEFSYSAIIALYGSEVTINYLQNMAEEDVLDTYSYAGIIALFSNDVPVSYLEELKSRDLLDTMSYVDVISSYLIDN